LQVVASSPLLNTRSFTVVVNASTLLAITGLPEAIPSTAAKENPSYLKTRPQYQPF
jgi:hypothetical protein